MSEEQEPFVDGKRIPLIWPGGCAPVLRRSGLETPEERADRLAGYLMSTSSYMGQLWCDNARMANRVRRHRRIITRLLADRRAMKAALRGMLPENCGLADDPSGGGRPSFEKCEAARRLIGE